MTKGTLGSVWRRRQLLAGGGVIARYSDLRFVLLNT